MSAFQEMSAKVMHLQKITYFPSSAALGVCYNQ